jgi:hypothetical protein
MLERGGHLRVQHVEQTDMDTVTFVVTKHVSQECTLSTDQSRAYAQMHQYYHHISVDHSANQYVNGMAHTNSIEGFWSQFKRGIDGIYHWISVKHLQAYAEEFAYRYNSREITESQRFNLVLTNLSGRLKYEELIAKK